MLLKFVFDPPLWFSQNDWAEMQQLEPSWFIIGASSYSPEDLC